MGKLSNRGGAHIIVILVIIAVIAIVIGAISKSQLLVGVGGIAGFVAILIGLWILFVIIVKNPVGAFVLAVIVNIIVALATRKCD